MDEKQKDQVRSLVGRAVDTALVPFHAAVSKPAQKAYLGTAFFAVTSIFLLCVASAAYWIFYFSYIPQVAIERVIHLQFGSDGSPWGTAALDSALTSQQAYDMTLSLHLPLTPTNLAAGNFMVDVSLLAPNTAKALDNSPPITSGLNTSSSVLARSRRPAILTYTSTLVNTANTLTGLPWYVLGWKRESEALEVQMFEGVEFAKGRSNVPDRLKVVIEPDPEAKMQFYDVGVRIVARFGGLRWILYHHKYFSFLIFTTMFWSSSMLSMLLVWLGLSMYLSSTSEEKSLGPKKERYDSNGAIKSEPTDSEATFDPTSLEDLSDTSRTFPTLGSGRAPLHFPGKWASKEKDEEAERLIKREAEGDEVDRMAGTASLTAGTEADDEDEGMGSEWRDSGIGTSREDERREEVRRRRKVLMGSGAGK